MKTKFEELMDALIAIRENTAGTTWFPDFILQKDMDLTGYAKQPSSSELFEYIYEKEQKAENLKDSWCHYQLYPFKEWFIKVSFAF